MAMAGLIQQQQKQAINGLPGLSTLPVLGTLFRSRDFVNNQTELMVLVTPYIVRAVAPKELSRPDDGFAAASDPQADLLGQHQSHLRRSGPHRSGTELSRHLRLHYRLRRDKDEDDDNENTRRPQSGAAAWQARWSVLPASPSLGGCMHTGGEVTTREHPRGLSPAPSDRDPGSQPVGRDLRRSRAAAAFPPSSAPT